MSFENLKSIDSIMLRIFLSISFRISQDVGETLIIIKILNFQLSTWKQSLRIRPSKTRSSTWKRQIQTLISKTFFSSFLSSSQTSHHFLFFAAARQKKLVVEMDIYDGVLKAMQTKAQKSSFSTFAREHKKWILIMERVEWKLAEFSLHFCAPSQTLS